MQPITADTIGRMAAEMLRATISEGDRKRIADLLNDLAEDMAAMRRMEVGVAEPAFVYDAAWSGPDE